MHLLKISISKDTYARRKDLTEALPAYGLCEEKQLGDILPAERANSDAVRVAASYTLLRYQRFYDHQGRICKAIAKSPKNATKRGLDVQINVQACGDEKVEYSEEVLRLTAASAHSMPEVIRQEASEHYEQLCRDMAVETLLEHGKTHAYDGDIRKIIERVLLPYTVGLWTGLSLVLDETGIEFIGLVQKLCDREMMAGKVTLSTLALDMSHANRQALARELGEEFTEQLAKLLARCAYTAPNAPAIIAAYEALASKIAQTESVLGIPLPCQDTQLALETAIMALE